MTITNAHKKIEMAGLVFGKLKVISVTEKKQGRNRLWLCDCACGGQVERTAKYLNFRMEGACCNECLPLRLQRSSETLRNKPSKTAISSTKLYGIWSGMKGRCYRPTDKKYHIYGARGISINELWLNFKL